MGEDKRSVWAELAKKDNRPTEEEKVDTTEILGVSPNMSVGGKFMIGLVVAGVVLALALWIAPMFK